MCYKHHGTSTSSSMVQMASKVQYTKGTNIGFSWEGDKGGSTIVCCHVHSATLFWSRGRRCVHWILTSHFLQLKKSLIIIFSVAKKYQKSLTDFIHILFFIHYPIRSRGLWHIISVKIMLVLMF